jgi:hypothetical protein
MASHIHKPDRIVVIDQRLQALTGLGIPYTSSLPQVNKEVRIVHNSAYINPSIAQETINVPS